MQSKLKYRITQNRQRRKGKERGSVAKRYVIVHTLPSQTIKKHPGNSRDEYHRISSSENRSYSASGASGIVFSSITLRASSSSASFTITATSPSAMAYEEVKIPELSFNSHFTAFASSNPFTSCACHKPPEKTVTSFSSLTPFIITSLLKNRHYILSLTDCLLMRFKGGNGFLLCEYT